MLRFIYKRRDEINPLKTDLTSHLLPTKKNGELIIDKSVELIKRYKQLGYEKLILTPQITGSLHENAPNIIRHKVAQLQKEITRQNINMELIAAAQYFIDDSFIKKLERGIEVLTFGKNYLIFEPSLLHSCEQIKDVAFMLQSLGITPVIAHPEYCFHLEENYSSLKKLHNNGLKIQLNINSLSGIYSKSSQSFAKRLIKDKLVSFVGSGCFKDEHLDNLKATMNTSIFKKALQLPLLNHSI